MTLEWEETLYNNGKVLELKAWLNNPSIQEVIEGLQLLVYRNLIDARVEVEYEPDPYGGFGFQYITVTGKLPHVFTKEEKIAFRKDFDSKVVVP